VTNGGSLDLQIDHMLGVFAACETLSQSIRVANFSNNDAAIGIEQDDPLSSGRRLRLRIESLLI
jgi:hypothetical protein